MSLLRKKEFNDLSHLSLTKGSKLNLIIASFAINILSLSFPIMTMQIYDRVLSNGSIITLKVLAISVSLIIFLEVLMRLSRAYIVSWSASVYEHNATSYAIDHILNSDILESKKYNIGEYLQNIYSIARLRDFYSGQALITVIDIPFISLFIGLIWYLAGSLVLVPVALLVIFTCLALLIGSHIKRKISIRDKFDNYRFDFIIEALKGIHTVKSLGVEGSFLRRYEYFQSLTNNFNYSIAVLSMVSSSIGALASQIMTISVVAFGSLLVINETITIGTLIACVILAGRIMQPIQRAMAIWTKFQDYQLGKERISDLLSIHKNEFDESSVIRESKGHIIFENVSFQYGKSEPFLFEDINFKLEKGKAFAIQSNISRGKTTLLKLMAGIYKPTSGNIYIDGLEPHKYHPEDLVNHVGYLASQGSIFKGTIRQNLAGFSIKNKKHAIDVARLLGIEGAISKLPQGYETNLEDNNADTIPPGLKQRIAIGRILSFKPSIILFDDTDSSLDKVGLEFTANLLKNLKQKTSMVIVSENKELLDIADSTLIIKDKKLIQMS